MKPTRVHDARAFRVWNGIVAVVSGEFLLTSQRRANGGAMILARALLATVQIYGLALVFKNALDPARAWTFDAAQLRAELVATLPWFGAIFAAAYVALYSRFAAQWAYLANLYNQIKQAEVRTAKDLPEAARFIVQWKAGFIEDASELHLAAKPLFASVIRVWGRDGDVQAEFARNTAGGTARLDAMLGIADAVHAAAAQKWPQHATKVAGPRASVTETPPN